MMTEDKKLKEAIFAAGCFWGVEATFRETKGVKDTEVGYTGGHTKNPTYEEVCGGTTGHAEAVRVFYDPEEVGYEKLLEEFFKLHDPTTLNRQGPDVGAQYRSAIFYSTEEEKKIAETVKEKLGLSGQYQNKIVTEIAAAGPFYRAEDYHQQYFAKKGGGVCHY